jgi:phosphonatase-like hydrolase
MAAQVRLVVMDMAGTTVQDLHEVEMCFAEAAKRSGLNASEEEILAIQGWSKRYVFELFWERQLGSRGDEWLQKVEQSFQTFREVLEHHYKTQPVLPTEGALEVFTFLRQHNIKIALTTGFYRQVTDIILDRLGWMKDINEAYLGGPDAIIDFTISGDQVAQGRPAPFMIYHAMEKLGITNIKEVITVGDTPSDIGAGHNAGVLYSLAVANGTHPAEKLLPHHPDFMLENLGDLISFIQEKKLAG